MWSAMVAEELVALKRQGMDFETAWATALAVHPPMRRDLGAAQQRLAVDGDGEADVQEESLVDFFKRAAHDAWGARPSVLRHMDQLLDVVDGIEEAAQERRALGGRHSRDRLVA